MDFDTISLPDSAYGSSPTLTKFKHYDDEWRFEIHPEDTWNSEMYKSNSAELLPSASIESIGSLYYADQTCISPMQVFDNSMFNDQLLNTQFAYPQTMLDTSAVSMEQVDLMSPFMPEYGFTMDDLIDHHIINQNNDDGGKKLGAKVVAKKDYACTLCSSAFSRNHDLKRHFRIHLGIRPYKCDYCPKSFTRMDALHRHSLIKGCKRS